MIHQHTSTALPDGRTVCLDCAAILAGDVTGHEFHGNQYVKLSEGRIEDLKKDPTVFWHGTASGDLRGGTLGLHVGTHKAARQALEATIGIRADGKDWDGTKEYGKTLLMGTDNQERIEKQMRKKTGNEFFCYGGTGFNCDAPKHDFYVTDLPKEKHPSFSNREKIPLTVTPRIFPFRITGDMANSPKNPMTDDRANSLAKREKKKFGALQRGHYYRNIGEDSGSISAVIPSEKHLKIINAGESEGHDFRGNQWTGGKYSGTGTKSDPIVTDSPILAAKALRDDKYVQLKSKDQVCVMLDKMREMVADAKAKGQAAGTYDLCKVTIPKTSLFCAESKNIPRVKMPQLSGIPIQGSPADKMEKNAKGKVNLIKAFVQELRDDGVDVDSKRKTATHLKASQNQLNGVKVAELVARMDGGDKDARDKEILVSRDNYVIDGHHHWAAVVALDTKDDELDEKHINVRKVDLDIIDVLHRAKEFSKRMGIPPKSIQAGDLPGHEFRGNQYTRVTDNPNFKEWFGNSKAVDARGNPRVFYHGTFHDFDAFDIKPDRGAYFTSSPALASRYRSGISGHNVIPAYLSIQNPYDGLDYRAVDIAKLKKKGFDGIITKEGGSFIAVAFEPSQIKSAIGNSGEFSDDDARLTAGESSGHPFRGNQYTKGEEGGAHINTPQFKHWFGESKVVDEAGKPLVVYHGGIGAAKIKEFDSGYGGQTTGNNDLGFFHFTSEKQVADDYSRQAFIRRYQDDPESLVTDKILPEGTPISTTTGAEYDRVEELAEGHISTAAVYLKMENPIVIDLEGQMVDTQEIERLEKFIATGEDDKGDLFDKYLDQMIAPYDPAEVAQYKDDIDKKAREEFSLSDDEPIDEWQFKQATQMFMDDNGYSQQERKIDGIIIRNGVDNIGDQSNIIADQFIVRDPTQIKSAVNNKVFDPDDPSINGAECDHERTELPDGRTVCLHCARVCASEPIKAAILYDKPVTFAEALAHHATKAIVPTNMGSAQLKKMGADFFQRAFTSAHVQSAKQLTYWFNAIEDIMAGKSNIGEARVLFNQQFDNSPLNDRWRQDLLVKTNLDIAKGLGRTLQDLTPEAVEGFPAWEFSRFFPRLHERGDPYYKPGTDGSIDWTERWQDALTDGGSLAEQTIFAETGRMIALKDSDVWQALGDGAGGREDTLGNDFPPFAWQSGMRRSEVSRNECIALGLIDAQQVVEPEDPEINNGFVQPADDVHPELLDELKVILKGTAKFDKSKGFVLV